MNRYECGCCGRRLPAEKMIRSSFTKQRYCAVDFKRCEAGSRRRRKSAKSLTTTDLSGSKNPAHRVILYKDPP